MESRFSKFYSFQTQGPFDQEPSRVNLLERIKPIVTKWSENFSTSQPASFWSHAVKNWSSRVSTHSPARKRIWCTRHEKFSAWCALDLTQSSTIDGESGVLLLGHRYRRRRRRRRRRRNLQPCSSRSNRWSRLTHDEVFIVKNLHNNVFNWVFCQR